jgi:hypothetical protein
MRSMEALRAHGPAAVRRRRVLRVSAAAVPGDVVILKRRERAPRLEAPAL